MKYLILAGGKGTRLWPLSRNLFAKQFLNLINDKSMLQNTALRISKENGRDIYIISNEDSKFIIKDQMSEIFGEFDPNNLLIEPAGRNTAPAIAFSTLFFDDNDIIAVLSSDHHIENISEFNNILNEAEKIADKGYIVTLGIVPDSPKTGYGYIKKSENMINEGYIVDKFVEKPNLENAKIYYNSSDFFWNAGIFIFKKSIFFEELKIHSPSIYDTVIDLNKKIKNDEPITLNDYNKFEKISIDYALMEKTKKVVVIPSEFGWNDVGSFKSLHEILEKDDNNNAIKINSNKFVNINSNNLLVIGNKRVISTINIKDLIIVDTDDALLISDNKHTEDVKEVYNRLLSNDSVECENHTKVYRPWGFYLSLLKKETYQVKQLYIRPGKQISYQYHNKRSETWSIVKGIAEVTKDNEILKLKPTDSIFIPVKTKHRLKNPSNSEELVLIEVQNGEYLGEDDIIRIKDDFGRK